MTKTYAIADLHGRFDLLCAALDRIAAHAGGDFYTVVTMGDYVDRGPQSAQIIDRLMRASASKTFREIVCLKGNHEDMMVETLRKPLHPEWWIGNGGGATLLSYGHPRSGTYHPGIVPAAHLDWLSSLPVMRVDKHRIFVHAGVDPTISLGHQTEKDLLWMRYPDGADLGHGDRHVVHGHHQFENGPICLKNRTDLDTNAWKTGRLVAGVFDDDKPSGPVDLIEVQLEWDPRYTLEQESVA